MKTKLFAILVALLTINVSIADEGDSCGDAVREHLSLVDSTEDYIDYMKAHAKTITGFEITQLQKKMTARFASMKNIEDLYSASLSACKPRALGESVLIYDFTKMSESVFAHTEMRRIVMGFINYEEYNLIEFKDYYRKYTSHELITQVSTEIATEGIPLPPDIKLDPSVDYNSTKTFSDRAVIGVSSTVAGAARVWGFLSDHLKWRQGYLKNNIQVKSDILSKLRPLDLIYEKRTFVLSNYTIPGHWGHVAVWLGTKEELIELGIWDKPFFAQFRDYVETGHNIIEIRKDGLGFQKLDTFLNLDEIAVTRIAGVLDRAEEIYNEMTVQVNKKYDFIFNSRTADKITCAEFIAFSYGDIKWPESKTLFLYTVKPDDLAKLTLEKQSPASFVLYYKGQKKGKFTEMEITDWEKLFKEKKKKKNNSNSELEFNSIDSDEKEKGNEFRFTDKEMMDMYGGA